MTVDDVASCDVLGTDVNGKLVCKTATPAAVGDLLLESGDVILLESGDALRVG